MDDQPTTSTSGQDAPRRSILSPVVAVVLALIVILASAGAVMALGNDDPDGDSAEAGFLRDMVTHHAQAVEMSMIVYRRTAADDMVTMTYDMATTQQAQIGMMIGTLDHWGLAQTGSEPAMAWMGHPTTGPMPGMATSDQIAMLQTLPPAEADVLLLQLMIVHHLAGVDMANALLERSDDEDARRLAERIAQSQDVEIANMNAMLVDRGQTPYDRATAPGLDGTPTHPGHGG